MKNVKNKFILCDRQTFLLPNIYNYFYLKIRQSDDGKYKRTVGNTYNVIK